MIKFLNIILLCVVLLIAFCPDYTNAQENNETITLNYEPKLSGEVYNFSMRSGGDDYYLENDWIRGDILLTSGKKVKNKQIKYNCYLDELIWLSAKSYQQVKVDKNLIEEFTIYLSGKQEPAVFKNVVLDRSLAKEPKNTFLQKLYEGNISLMAHRSVKKTGERLVSSSSGLILVPRLSAEPEFYILTEDNEILEVQRLRRRSLYNIFPEKRDQIRSVFRDERLRIRSEDDLIQAVSLIDEIVSKSAHKSNNF